MLQRFDRYWIGILLGLIMPTAFGLIYIDHYNLWYTFQTFGNLLNPTFSKLLQVSVFPNLGLVFVFYAADAWKLSKGVLAGALPYIVAAVALAV